MSVGVRELVVARLRVLRDRPCMFACTREGFAAQVAVLLDLLDVKHGVYDSFRIPGTNVVDREALSMPVDDTWARELLDKIMAFAELELEVEARG